MKKLRFSLGEAESIRVRLAPFGFGVGVDDLKCFETLDFDAYATPLRSIPLLMVPATVKPF